MAELISLLSPPLILCVGDFLLFLGETFLSLGKGQRRDTEEGKERAFNGDEYIWAYSQRVEKKKGGILAAQKMLRPQDARRRKDLPLLLLLLPSDDGNVPKGGISP